MPAAESTLVSLPPQSVVLGERRVGERLERLDLLAALGAAVHVCRHGRLRLAGRRGLALDAYECQSYLRRRRTARSAAAMRPDRMAAMLADRAPRPRGLAARDVPERAARRPGPRPRHHDGGFGQPRRVERRPAARLAGGRARAARSTSPRARSRPASGLAIGGRAGRVRPRGRGRRRPHAAALPQGRQGRRRRRRRARRAVPADRRRPRRVLVRRRPGAAQGVARVAPRARFCSRSLCSSSATTDGKSESSVALAVLVVAPPRGEHPPAAPARGERSGRSAHAPEEAE